jgi:hypothetical protein
MTNRDLVQVANKLQYLWIDFLVYSEECGEDKAHRLISVDLTSLENVRQEMTYIKDIFKRIVEEDTKNLFEKYFDRFLEMYVELNNIKLAYESGEL